MVGMIFYKWFKIVWRVEIKLFKINRTIRKDLVITILLAITIPFLTISFIYTNSIKNIINQDVKIYQEAIIKQSSSSLSNIFSSVKMIQRSALGKVISDYIPISYNSTLDKNDILKLKDLIEFLYITDNASSYVNGIYVIFESGYTVSSRNGIREKLLINREWIAEAKASRSSEIYTEFHLAEYNVASPRGEYDSVISVVQEFILPEKNGARVIVQIDIDRTVFNNFVGSIENNEQIPMFLINSKKGKILLENEIYSEYSQKIDRKEIIVKEEVIRDILYLYAYIPTDRIINRFKSVIVGILLIISFVVLISVVTAILLSRTITAPLHELFLCMKQVGQGDFSPVYPHTKYSEVDFLIESFKTMVNEVNNLIALVSRQQSEASEAKFQALQAKINPHFLYNTLDVIRSIALENNNSDISDMTLSLSRLFRYNVGDLKKTNSIGNEILYIKDYLKIQNYRFGDRITVNYDLEPELNNMMITRFILQPIVENAFKYGLELRGRGGELRISGKIEDNDIVISVYDNGPGIEPSKLEFLKSSLSAEPNIKSITKAHGLDNVNLRMKLLYGEKYGLFINSEYGKWTCMNIKIPIIYGEDCDKTSYN